MYDHGIITIMQIYLSVTSQKDQKDAFWKS